MGASFIPFIQERPLPTNLRQGYPPQVGILWLFGGRQSYNEPIGSARNEVAIYLFFYPGHNFSRRILEAKIEKLELD